MQKIIVIKDDDNDATDERHKSDVVQYKQRAQVTVVPPFTFYWGPVCQYLDLDLGFTSPLGRCVKILLLPKGGEGLVHAKICLAHLI